MYILYAIFAKYLDTCKNFYTNLANKNENMTRSFVVPRF